jgi:hypothetical protein
MAMRLTRHAIDRARQRHIPLEVIQEVCDDPDTVRPSGRALGREIRTRTCGDETIEVVIDTTDGTVVTVWHRRPR